MGRDPPTPSPPQLCCRPWPRPEASAATTPPRPSPPPPHRWAGWVLQPWEQDALPPAAANPKTLNQQERPSSLGGVFTSHLFHFISSPPKPHESNYRLSKLLRNKIIVQFMSILKIISSSILLVCLFLIRILASIKQADYGTRTKNFIKSKPPLCIVI